MKTLSELFEVFYGNKFDLNKMRIVPGGIHFVGRSSENHGVSASVAKVNGVEPYAKGLITVALGGTKLLSAFVQEAAFYTAQNVAVLRPKAPMSFAERLFACLCIRHNRFRYSAFGREANRSIKTLLIPEQTEFPNWNNGHELSIETLAAPKQFRLTMPLGPSDWKPFELQELFDIRKGKRLTKAHMSHGTTPFIGAVDKNNGVSGFISRAPLHKGNTITVTYNGSVGEAFYQEQPFWCSDDVNVLYPNFALTPSIAMFLVTIIRLERFRYSYGRKWDLERMKPTKIKLPATQQGEPDWAYMERYISALPFSGRL